MKLIKLIPILLLLFFSYWAVKPLLESGFFPMHDDTQVARVIEMGKALRNGQFPVRWVGDLGYGYGYPVFNFYGPLPYYVGGFLYWFGVDALLATKAMFIIGILFSAVTMYVLIGSLLGAPAGFLSGILFLYAPYHAVDIYVRGAVGEFWAIAFLPLVLYGLIKAREREKNWIIGAFALAGVIVSHTILGYITVSLVTVGIICYSIIRRTFIKNLFLLLFLGVGLSAFFWLPAVLEMGYTNVSSQIGGTADFKNHFVCVSQLWNSPWGFGGSAPGCLDGMSFQLGKLLLILGVISLIFVRNAPVVWGIIINAISIFFMISLSGRVWELIPGSAFIQYPWRFLSYGVVGLSMAGGSVVEIVRDRRVRWAAAIGLSIIIVFFYSKLFSPQYLYERRTSDFESANDLRWRVSKISDEYLPANFKKPDRFEDTPEGPFTYPESVIVDTEINTETYVKAHIASLDNSEVRINRAIFPGWHYLVDGKDVKATVLGRIPNIIIPSGAHVVEIQFSDTPVRYFANLLTIFSLLAVLYLINRKT